MRTTLLCLVLLMVCGACGGSERTTPDPEPDAQVPGDGSTDDGSTDAAPPSASCGGLTRVACAANEYCDYADNSCGIADAPGTCKRRPDKCPQGSIIGRPVCACDGKVHSSDCIAFSEGFDLNANGCPVPTGSFACGYAVCGLQTQYCRREVKPPAADLYSCVELPQDCPAGTPTCECLRSQPCGTSCTGDARVGLTLTCE